MFFIILQRSLELEAIFIDTFYNPRDNSEVSKFQKYTNQLWNFADTVEPFECKDIKIALNELMEAQKKLENMTQTIDKLKDQMEKNNQNSNCFWGFCFQLNPIEFGSLTSVMIIIGVLLAVIFICVCQNPCNCCCTCWKNLGNCSKCCFPGQENPYIEVDIDGDGIKDRVQLVD